MWLFLLLGLAHAKEACSGLVLASCGDLGAYQAGVLNGILAANPNLTYDVITGIDTGALNAFILSKKPSIPEGIKSLEAIWKGMSWEDLYQEWTFRVIEGLLAKSSLYDSSTSLNFLKKFGATTYHKNVVVGASSVTEGEYLMFDNGKITDEAFVLGVLGSNAKAAFFSPVEITNSTGAQLILTDGSLNYQVDVSAAVEKCRNELGFQKVNIDMISCYSYNPPQVDASDYKSLQMLYRYIQLREWVGTNADIYLTEQAYSHDTDVNFARVIMPKLNLETAWFPYNYKPEELAAQYAQGVADGMVPGNRLTYSKDLRIYSAAAGKQNRQKQFFK